MPNYTTADELTNSMVGSIMRRHHVPLVEAGLTVTTLFASPSGWSLCNPQKPGVAGKVG